jgi:hypothetical protein
LKTPSDKFDWVDVWLDIGHLYHSRGTDEDVRELLTRVRATAPESNPGDSGEHPAKAFLIASHNYNGTSRRRHRFL